MAYSEDKKLDIPEFRNKQWPQWLVAITASLSYFTAGICFLWSSPSLAILQSNNSPFPITNSEASWIAAFLPIGCGVGPFVGSWAARHIGPRTSTLLSSIPMLFGFALIIVADNAEWLYASRFLCGFAVGVGQSTTTIYVAEIAETKNRGTLTSFVSFSMGIGALFMTVLGPYLSLSSMALISMTFPILMLMSMMFLPESPYFLVRMQKEERALKCLMWLRRQKNESGVKQEFEEIKLLASENMRLRDSLKLIISENNLKKLGIITLTFIGQSFCGAIVVMFFQEQIYDKTKVPLPPEVAVIITAAISNLSGVLSLVLVDRWGRKPLLLVSTLGCAASTGLIGLYLHLDQSGSLVGIDHINWTPVVALNTLQIFFYFGLSPTPATQLGEIFCSNVKEIAFCYGFTIASLSGVIITKLYQVIEDAYGMSTVFWCLSAVTIVIFFLMISIIPETKGKSFAEIQSSLFKKEDSMRELYVSTVNVSENYAYDNANFKNVLT